MNTGKIIMTAAVLAAIAGSAVCNRAEACTGITLKSKNGAYVYARTIEWGGSNLESRYVVVPRGHAQRSYLPDGSADGNTLGRALLRSTCCCSLNASFRNSLFCSSSIL